MVSILLKGCTTGLSSIPFLIMISVMKGFKNEGIFFAKVIMKIVLIYIYSSSKQFEVTTSTLQRSSCPIVKKAIMKNELKVFTNRKMKTFAIKEFSYDDNIL